MLVLGLWQMRYKAEYKPAQLLCPQTFTFVPLEPAVAALDKAKYSILLPADEGMDGLRQQEETLQQVLYWFCYCAEF